MDHFDNEEKKVEKDPFQKFLGYIWEFTFLMCFVKCCTPDIGYTHTMIFIPFIIANLLLMVVWLVKLAVSKNNKEEK